MFSYSNYGNFCIVVSSGHFLTEDLYHLYLDLALYSVLQDSLISDVIVRHSYVCKGLGKRKLPPAGASRRRCPGGVVY